MNRLSEPCWVIHKGNATSAICMRLANGDVLVSLAKGHWREWHGPVFNEEYTAIKVGKTKKTGKIKYGVDYDGLIHRYAEHIGADGQSFWMTDKGLSEERYGAKFSQLRRAKSYARKVIKKRLRYANERIEDGRRRLKDANKALKALDG